MKNQTIYYNYSHVGMMTFLNWVPPPQYSKAWAAMEVVVVDMVTSAQEEEQVSQEEQIQ